MSRNDGKLKKTIWVNFSVLALLLVSGSLALTACQNVKLGPQSTKQQKEKQSTKSNPKNSDKQLKQNQSSESKQKKSDQQPKDGQDTQTDDDPE